MATIIVADDNSIMAATISLWRRGDISQDAFEMCVKHWKTLGIVPIDFDPSIMEN